MLDEGGLNGVQDFALGQPFDRGDLRAVQADGKRQTGIDAPAVDQHRAGAALAAVAALLGSGEIEPLAQQVEQGDARILKVEFVLATVDGKADGE